MKLVDTTIAGVVILELDPIYDERGFFARSFERSAFLDSGLMTDVVETNISFNPLRGTLRGLHYQAEPHPDPKIVRCVRGSLFDVAVDLRRNSATYGRWVGVDLSAGNRRALHIPAGCAHGFMTLEEDTEVHYLMGAPYYPELARGLSWKDPDVAIDWPLAPSVISERDRSFGGLAS